MSMDDVVCVDVNRESLFSELIVSLHYSMKTSMSANMFDNLIMHSKFKAQ